ncbi:MAG: cytochrome C [Rhodospirillaceae bacterium]|nr:MAG: cytochrome C [Rhodospirillaceae bacterium]
MNFRNFFPSLAAVFLAFGVLGLFWFGNNSEASSAPEAASAKPAAAPADSGATSDLALGKKIYKKANCIGCHKWHGDGGGGYGGAALSLRETFLDQEQLVEVIACGRPTTGMPAFHRKAYKTYNCYDMTMDDLGEDKPPKPVKRLRDADIARVAAYVFAKIKGQGDMTKAQCTDFWGDGARECNRFK